MRCTLRRRASLGAAFALGVGFSALAAHPAAAQTTVYSNTTNFLGAGYAPGGATSATGSTPMDADDLTLLPGSAGLAVSGFTFSIANFNAVAVTASPTVSFYSTSASGGPGTLLYTAQFSPLGPGAGSVGTYSYNPTGTGLFNLPKGTLWAGMSFSIGGGTATLAQLNEFGQGLFNPPTVGSSTDGFFETDNPVTTTASNPVGAFYAAPFSNAVANFGWSIRTVNPPAVPEASTTVSLGLLLALGMGGLAVASRRKKVSVKA